MPDPACFLCKGKGFVNLKAGGTSPCNFCADEETPTPAGPAPSPTQLHHLLAGKVAPPADEEAEDEIEDDDAEAEAEDAEADDGSGAPVDPYKTVTTAMRKVLSSIEDEPPSKARKLAPINEKTTIQKIMAKLGGTRRPGNWKPGRFTISFVDLPGGGVDVAVAMNPEPGKGEPLSPAMELGKSLLAGVSDFVEAGGFNGCEKVEMDENERMLIDSGIATPEEIAEARKRNLEKMFAGITES